ncbi:MAG: DUF4091 domain-containing protein [Phycisphaerae bacterium]|nr:DUF4091 domain-containing protein [Phycisphaerae bacterium]
MLAIALAAAAVVAGCPQTREQPQATIQVGENPVRVPAQPETVAPSPTEPGRPAAGRPTAGPMTVTSLGRVSPMVPLWDAGNQRINLAGCGREVVAFQFSLAPPPGGLSGVKVSLTDLELVAPRGANKIRRQTIEVFRVLPTRVVKLPAWHQLYETTAVNRASGDFPDVLIPSDNTQFGQPWNVPANDKLSLWLDVPVPADLTPGAYEGRVTITADNAATTGFSVRLDVLPINLPPDASLTMLAPLDVKQMLASELGRAELSDAYVLGEAKAFAAKRLAQWVELGRQHGVQFIAADLAPVFKRDLAGKVEVDWSGYDQVVGPHLAGAAIWLAPFRLDYPDPALYGGLKAAPYRDVAEQYLRSVGTHGKSKKWPKAIAWVHRDRPRESTLPYGLSHWRDWLTEQRKQESMTLGELVFRVEMDFGYMDMLPWPLRKLGGADAVEPTTRPAVGGLSVSRQVPPHVTVYCPPAQFLDPAGMPAVLAEGVKIWLGQGEPPWRPSTEVFAHPEQIETLAYAAHRYGLSTIWLGPTQTWPAKSPLVAPVAASEANFLFYSGHWFEQDRPVASVRLKHLRQAAQDAAYLRLLNELRRRTQADAIAGAVCKYALAEASAGESGLGGAIGWVQDPALFADARIMLRQELLVATNRAGKPEAAASRARFLWLNMHERTGWIRLQPLPGQLVDQLDNFGVPNGTLRSVFRLVPYIDRAAANPTVPGEPIAQMRWPTLGFATLPATWKATRFNVPVEGQPPGPATVVSLSADGTELPIDPQTARVSMPLTLKGDVGAEPVALTGAVPVLPAHPFRQPPTIDGRLDEWPTGNWFRASGFHRLAMAEPISLFAQPAPPPVDTWFMAAHDDQSLYLAIACLGQKPSEVTSRYTNNIQFDRGLIVGEDAVEVVLDPTGGRLDRQQLLHLAVKPTGVTLGWRGMAGADNIGPPQAWGRTVRTAVSPQPTYWLVEIAIPRAELGLTNAQGLWRINVARHLAALGEHSAWASPSPLLGEPESLGNLLLRRPPLPKREVEVVPPVPIGD